MGRFLMFVGLAVLVLDLVAESPPSYAPVGFGLILTGGFLHLAERR